MHDILTPRAALRPVCGADLENLHRLFTDAGVRRHLWDDEIIPLARTAAVIGHSEHQFEAEGHGLWLALERDGSEALGFCGFWYFHEPPRLELLYGVAPSSWGRGLATELAQAMLRHGFDSLGFDRIEGSTDVANAASVRVMEKSGMRLVERRMAEGRDTVFFAADRGDRV